MIVASVFARLSSQNAQLAGQNLLAAQFASTQAIDQQSLAQAASTQAIAQQSTAQAEANTRATAEAVANDQTRLATSRELAAASINNLQIDSQRSLLLAMQGVKTENTLEAIDALHQAIQASRLTQSISIDSQALFGAAFSPDGNHIAAISDDGNIYIWSIDATTMKVDPASRQTIPDPVDFDGTGTDGNTLAFSPDGKWLAGVAGQQAANIWDVSTGKLLHNLTGHTQDVISVTFSPDGKLVVTGGGEGDVKIWEAASGKELQTLTGFQNWVEVVRFSPDGSQLVAGSDDGTMIDWKLVGAPGRQVSFSERFRMDLNTDSTYMVAGLAFSPDGNRLALGQTGNIRVYDIQSASPTSLPVLLTNVPAYVDTITGLYYSPGGDRLYSSSYQGLAKVWDAATGEELFSLAANSGWVDHLAINPAGTRVATANSDGSLKIWDVTDAGNQEWFTLTNSLDGWNGSFVNQDRSQIVTLSENTPAKWTYTFWDITPTGLSRSPA
ncbi:MAG TPA: WD40 repeat domain-containing protein, partial [Candidatus Acidoferrum sp.]|nr:WD40 repeat domain-containing protein [Candidatus Acidoferrum sp.]